MKREVKPMKFRGNLEGREAEGQREVKENRQIPVNRFE